MRGRVELEMDEVGRVSFFWDLRSSSRRITFTSQDLRELELRILRIASSSSLLISEEVLVPLKSYRSELTCL